MNTLLEDEIYGQGFHIIDNFLAQEHYEILRAKAELMYNQGQFRSAKIGHQANAMHNSAIRKDNICWLDEETTDSAISAYFNNIRAIAKKLNQTLLLGLIDFETHFAIYEPGAFYKKHVDRFTATQERRISCVYYLNGAWEASFAGQLKLYNNNDQLMTSVLPLGNRFICFNSDLPHEVSATNQPRYSITGWMKTRALSIY